MEPLTDDERKAVEEHLPLVRLVVYRHFKHLPVPYEDLVQEGVFGLVDALRRFDPSHGAQFSTYAPRRIWGWILDALRNENGRNERSKGRVMANTATLDRELVDHSPRMIDHRPGPEEHCLASDLRARLADALYDVDDLDRWVLEQYAIEGRSLAAIADDLAVTESRVCQMMASIRRQLGALAA